MIPSLKNSQTSRIIIHGVQKVAWVVGNHAFLFIIIFIVLNVLIGEFLFYRYVVSIQSKNSQSEGSFIRFQTTTYQSVLAEWEKRDDAFEKAGRTMYNDPFR